jgi:hypothetical protein
MRSKLFLLLLLVLLLPMPSALGISPGRIDIPFQPGFKNTYGFIVIPHMTPYLRLSVYGDLAQYVTLSQTEAVVKNGIGHFTFSVSLPDDLPRPGLYDTRILVTEFPGGFEGGGTGVGAKVAIELQFWVRKPYPGKYSGCNPPRERDD